MDKLIDDDVIEADAIEVITGDRINVVCEPKDISTTIGSYIKIDTEIRSPKPDYQWYNKFGFPIPDKCDKNLTLGPIQNEDFGFYRLEIIDESVKQKMLTRWVEVSNNESQDDPQQVELATDGETKPILLSAPKPMLYQKGQTFNLTPLFVNATSYQWLKEGVKLENCTEPSLKITDATLFNSGNYVLIASNAFGIETTPPIAVRIV